LIRQRKARHEDVTRRHLFGLVERGVILAEVILDLSRRDRHVLGERFVENELLLQRGAHVGFRQTARLQHLVPRTAREVGFDLSFARVELGAGNRDVVALGVLIDQRLLNELLQDRAAHRAALEAGIKGRPADWLTVHRRDGAAARTRRQGRTHKKAGEAHGDA
jgi:hypothetical protein